MEKKKSRFKNVQQRRELKQKVRKSPQWAELRNLIFERQNGCDYYTGKRLTRGWNCHHIYFGAEGDEEYDNLSPERFIGLNKGTHALLHEIARYRDRGFVADILHDLEKLGKGEKVIE